MGIMLVSLPLSYCLGSCQDWSAYGEFYRVLGPGFIVAVSDTVLNTLWALSNYPGWRPVLESGRRIFGVPLLLSTGTLGSMRRAAPCLLW